MYRYRKQATHVPAVGELAGNVGDELATNLPSTLALGGLAGGGLGALAGLATKGDSSRTAAIGAGAGMGGTVGAGFGSALAQIATRMGAPMFGYTPTSSMLDTANRLGTYAGAGLGLGAGGYLGHRVSNKDIEKKAAQLALKQAFMGSPEIYAGHHMAQAAEGHSNILPYAGVSGALGGGIGYAIGDTAGGIGGGAGAALGGAGGNILGTGLGGLGGALLARSAGIKDPAALNQMVDQWAQGGGQVGNVLGSLYGGYKGIGFARRLAEQKVEHDKLMEREKSSSLRKVRAVKIAASPAAAAAVGATPPPAPGTPGLFNLASLWPKTKVGKGLAIGGIGLGAMGLAGGLAASQYGKMYDFSRRQVADSDLDQRNYMKHDFLYQQQNLELDRQRALLRHLEYPATAKDNTPYPMS